MKKFDFATPKKKLVQDQKENSSDMMNTLLDILKLKLIIKILELLDK